MGRRIVGLLVLVLLIVGGYFAWQRYKENKQLASGETNCVGCMTPEEKARFDRENAGEAPVDPNEHKLEKRSSDVPAGFPDSSSNTAATATPAAQMDTATPAPGVQRITNTNAVYNPGPSTPGSTQAAAPVMQPSMQTTALPMQETISPNPPNGMLFGGKGTYQWYRQGNLTWRVDTASGRSCIIYATMEEWRKPVVMQHGCGRDS